MSEFISVLTNNYQLVVLIMSLLIVTISIITIYFTVKGAVYSGIKQAIKEYDFLQLIASQDADEFATEYNEMRDSVKKSHIMLSRIYRSMNNGGR